MVLFFFAAVTDFHKLSGLKQYKFISLAFWTSEVQNESQGVIGRALLEAPGEIPIPCLFQLLETTCVAWLLVHLLHLQSVSLQLLYLLSRLLLFLIVFPPFYKDPYDYIRPSRIIQDNHPSQIP